jgi:MtrB/PioB family decaheme-associated outer membrane protein
MNDQRSGLRLVLSLLLVSTSAWAGTTVSGEIDAGYQKRDVSANEATFDQYGKVPDGAVIPYASVNVVGDSDTVHFEGQNIQQNNQSYDLDYNHDYQTKIDASWEQIPHDYSNVGQTLYTQTVPGVLELPSQVQSNIPATKSGTRYSPNNQQVTTYNNQYSNFMTAAHNADLQTLDNKGAVNMDFRPSEHVKMNLGFSEDRVEGNKPMGASFGYSQAVQVPEPIDYRTYNLRAGTQYDTKDTQFGVKYQMSSFNNNIETLTWSNPARQTDLGTSSTAGVAGPAQGQMSLAPDNLSNTVTMNGGVNLPANTRFTATGTMAYMHQNDPLLPFTSNTALAATNPAGQSINPTSTASLPETSANADIMTWTQDYAVTNRVLKPLTLGLRYHSYQMINRTDEADFAGRAVMDSSWVNQGNGLPFVNNRYEFRKDLLTGSADYEVFQPLSLGFKYNVEWDHDTNRIVTDSTENGYAGDVTYKPAQWTTLRGSYLREHRVPHAYDYSLYLTPGTTSYAELPGLQQFDVGDRVRDQGKVIWQINPGPVTIGLNGSMTHDNYQPGNQDLTGATGSPTVDLPATLYGLQDNRDSSAGADIGWNASDRLAFDVYYDYEETQALLRSNSNSTITQVATKDWDLRMLDKYQVTGVNATIGNSVDRVTIRLGYDVTMSRGSDDYMDLGSAVTGVTTYVNGQSVAGTTPISPSDTKYMKQDISIRTTIKMTSHTSLVLGYLFEKYDVSDWQYQNIPLVSGTGVNSYDNYLGTNLQNYVAHVGTILIKYKF